MNDTTGLTLDGVTMALTRFDFVDGTLTHKVELGPEESVYADLYGDRWRSHWILNILQSKTLRLQVTGVS